LNSIKDIPPLIVPQSVHMMPPLAESITMKTGNNESNQTLYDSENPSHNKKETHSVKTSSNLSSCVNPSELLDKLQIVQPRVLKINKHDFNMFCQVLLESNTVFHTLGNRK
jgi:hypothetical protein